MVKKQSNLGLWVFLLSAIILFITFTILSRLYVDEIESFIGAGFTGMFIYVTFFVVEIIAAPVTAIPVIPLATSIWGWVTAGTLTLIGWTIGSAVVFLLTRKLGTPYLQNRSVMKMIYKYENLIPEKNIFIGIILLRFFLPFDIISYALGFLSKVKFRNYISATIIGFAPLSYILAYGANFPIEWQIILALAGIIIIAIFFFLSKQKKIKTKIQKRTKKIIDKGFKK